MKTIEDVFVIYRHGLDVIYGPQETEALTLMVLTEILGSTKATIKAFPERELSITQQEEANLILSQLVTGRPLQYILGYTEFYGLKFMVNPATLIPRPETEELVEWALSSVGGSHSAGAGLNILDIGTGSGCIAISLKKNLQGATVSAMDISVNALKVAKENAVLNDVEVNFTETDILNPISDPDGYRDENPKFDIIISNPPYVTLEDKKQMHPNVTMFEPHTALFVPEDDPLIFYRGIADFALDNLADKGLLFFEINESLGKETVILLEDKGFKNIELRQDMSGRDRMVKAEMN